MSLKTPRKLSLKDLEVRYENIRKSDPHCQKCSVRGCSNPRDSTPSLGQDTCCAYHRLLFDFWSCDIAPIRGHDILAMTQRGRRTAFTHWRNRMGKAELDKLVLRLMTEPINWEC